MPQFCGDTLATLIWFKTHFQAANFISNLSGFSPTTPSRGSSTFGITLQCSGGMTAINWKHLFSSRNWTFISLLTSIELLQLILQNFALSMSSCVETHWFTPGLTYNAKPCLSPLSKSESVKIYWLSVKFDWFK